MIAFRHSLWRKVSWNAGWSLTGNLIAAFEDRSNDCYIRVREGTGWIGWVAIFIFHEHEAFVSRINCYIDSCMQIAKCNVYQSCLFNNLVILTRCRHLLHLLLFLVKGFFRTWSKQGYLFQASRIFCWVTMVVFYPLYLKARKTLFKWTLDMSAWKSLNINWAQSEQTYPIGFLHGSGGEMVSRYSCGLARRSLIKSCAYWCTAWFYIPSRPRFKVIRHRLQLN